MSELKNINVKLYDRELTFKRTLSNKDIANRLRFTSEIDRGLGTLRIVFENEDLFSEFGFTDIIEVVENGTKAYRGVIVETEKVIDTNGMRLDIKCVGYQSVLRSLYYKDGSSQDFTKTDDPATIIEDILGQYNTAIGFDFFTWQSGGLEHYGSNVSLAFDNNTLLEALQKVLENQSWSLRFNADGSVEYFATGNAHRFTLGNNLSRVSVKQHIDELQNDVEVAYDGGTASDTDASSISSYGTYERDYDLTDIKDSATADARVSKELNKAEPVSDITLQVTNDPTEVPYTWSKSTTPREDMTITWAEWAGSLDVVIKVGDTVSTRNLNDNIIDKQIQRISRDSVLLDLYLDKPETMEKSLEKIRDGTT